MPRLKGYSAPALSLWGLLAGALLGLAANAAGARQSAAVEWANHYVAGPLGQIYVRLLLMTVIPLVFSQFVLGVVSLGGMREVGRVGARAAGFLFASAALAVTVGVLVATLLRPGEKISAESRAELMATFASDASVESTASLGVESVVNVVPRSPLRAAADLDVLATMVFGLVFGVALSMVDTERARPMVRWLEALCDVATKIVEIIMRLAPVGVAALIFGVTSRFGADLLRLLGWYVATVVLALVLHVGVNISGILRFVVGVSPQKFYQRAREALVTAFSTSSSAATLPIAMETAERHLGVPARVAAVVLPLGSTMGLNGTALFQAVAILTLAQTFGADLTAAQTAGVMGMSLVTSIGTAGVPGGSIPLLVGALAMFGVPGEGIAIILGVDRVLDMSRTCVNVCGDLAASAYVAKTEGAEIAPL